MAKWTRFQQQNVSYFSSHFLQPDVAYFAILSIHVRKYSAHSENETT